MTVKKYTSFEALKADTKKADNLELSLKRYKEFEKVIKYIRSHIVDEQGRSESK